MSASVTATTLPLTRTSYPAIPLSSSRAALHATVKDDAGIVDEARGEVSTGADAADVSTANATDAAFPSTPARFTADTASVFVPAATATEAVRAVAGSSRGAATPLTLTRYPRMPLSSSLAAPHVSVTRVLAVVSPSVGLTIAGVVGAVRGRLVAPC